MKITKKELIEIFDGEELPYINDKGEVDLFLVDTSCSDYFLQSACCPSSPRINGVRSDGVFMAVALGDILEALAKSREEGLDLLAEISPECSERVGYTIQKRDFVERALKKLLEDAKDE